MTWPIWESNTVAPNSDRKCLCERPIEVLEPHHLEQIQREPSREQAVLDLYCTNRPGLLKSSNTVPGISDHNIITVDFSIRSQQPKKPKRTIKQWSKVDWEAVKEESSTFWDDFLSHHNERTVESNYKAFCQHVNDIITSHVPTKQSNSRHKVPWLTTKIWHMCRKKQQLYNHAKKSRKEHHWSTYKSHKKSTTKALNKARVDYINGILKAGLDEGNSKPFWRYIFRQRDDRGGVAALKEDGKLHTGGQKKAEILNKQFTSVFSVDEPGSDTVLSGPSYPPITYHHAADHCSRSLEASDRNKPQQGCGPRPSTLPHTEGALSVSSHIHPITRLAYCHRPGRQHSSNPSPRRAPPAWSRKLPPCQLDVCNMQDAWTHHLPPCE